MDAAARSRRWVQALAMPALLLAITVGFYWKLTLTKQYTWIDSPDYSYQVMPWLQFQAREFHHKRFPLWDPYEWGGHTLIGQAQPGTAYPPNWLLFAMPLKNGYIRRDVVHWYYVLIHFMAALFAYLLCRDLKLCRAAALVGGVLFGLGGWMGNTEWPQMLNGGVWAPLVFLFQLRAVRGDNPVRHAGLAGAFLGVAFLSGHHQIPVFTSLAAGGVWVYGLARQGRKLLPALAFFAVMVGLMSALQTLPAIEYGRQAIRWVGARDPLGWAEKVPYSVHAKYSLAPISLLGTVIPSLYEHSNPFLGMAALSLALLGLVARWREPMVRVMLGVAIGGLIYAMAPYSPFQGIVYALTPMVDKARSAAMALFVFHFGVAALAAYGMDAQWREKTAGGTFGRRLVIALLVFAAVLWTVLLSLHMSGKPMARHEMAVIPLTAVFVAATLHGWRSGHVSNRAATAILCGVALMELSLCSSQAGWRNRDQGWEVAPCLDQDRDVIDFLRRNAGQQRVEIDEQVVPYNAGDWHGIEQFGAYLASLPLNISRVQANSHGRALFSVRYHVGRKPSRAGQVEVFSGASGLKVYQNAEWFPRAWSVHATTRLENGDHTGALLDQPLDELRKAAFLKDPAPALETCAEPDDVRLLEHSSNRLVIGASMACKGMVIASETWYPGWEARVDGQPVAIHETYGALRGVVVPAGRHRVEMRYRPWSVRAGAAATAAGLLAACALGFVGRRKKSGSAA